MEEITYSERGVASLALAVLSMQSGRLLPLMEITRGLSAQEVAAYKRLLSGLPGYIARAFVHLSIANIAELEKITLECESLINAIEAITGEAWARVQEKCPSLFPTQTASVEALISGPRLYPAGFEWLQDMSAQ